MRWPGFIIIIIGTIGIFLIWPKNIQRKTLVSKEDVTFFEGADSNQKNCSVKIEQIPMHGGSPVVGNSNWSPPQSLHSSAEKLKAKEKEQLDPYHIDQFTLRKLDV